MIDSCELFVFLEGDGLVLYILQGNNIVCCDALLFQNILGDQITEVKKDGRHCSC
jgi:hypothetical protein